MSGCRRLGTSWRGAVAAGFWLLAAPVTASAQLPLSVDEVERCAAVGIREGQMNFSFRCQTHLGRSVVKSGDTPSNAALESELPAPGDYAGAVSRADSLYTEVLSLVADALDALQEDDFPAFDVGVRAYRRAMPFLIVWQGRACWRADRGGARVGYPMQATMGEALAAWSAGRIRMADTELLRAFLASDVETHARTLRATRAELVERCR